MPKTKHYRLSEANNAPEPSDEEVARWCAEDPELAEFAKDLDDAFAKLKDKR